MADLAEDRGTWYANGPFTRLISQPRSPNRPVPQRTRVFSWAAPACLGRCTMLTAMGLDIILSGLSQAHIPYIHIHHISCCCLLGGLHRTVTHPLKFLGKTTPFSVSSGSFSTFLLSMWVYSLGGLAPSAASNISNQLRYGSRPKKEGQHLPESRESRKYFCSFAINLLARIKKILN